MRLPTASPFGQNFFARRSSTMTTRVASASSLSLKKRPLRSGMFSASKYPGETRCCLGEMTDSPGAIA